MLSAVLVQGPSMVPTLRPGDCLLVRAGGRVRPGDVVVARFPSRPGLLVIKRALREVAQDGAAPDDPGASGARRRIGGARFGEGGLWWVEGDAPSFSDDSRTYGPAQVVSRAVLRYWPLPPSRLR